MIKIEHKKLVVALASDDLSKDELSRVADAVGVALCFMYKSDLIPYKRVLDTVDDINRVYVTHTIKQQTDFTNSGL